MSKCQIKEEHKLECALDFRDLTSESLVLIFRKDSCIPLPPSEFVEIYGHLYHAFKSSFEANRQFRHLLHLLEIHGLM